MALNAGCYEPGCGPNRVLDEELEVCRCVEGTRREEGSNRCTEKDEDSGGGEVGLDGGVGDGGSADASNGGGGSDGTECLPNGLGCPCSSDADCADYEADYCVPADPNDPEGRRACLIQGCEEGSDECGDGLQCCSFFLAPEGTVCLPADVECPFG